jgi:hypothetical protein
MQISRSELYERVSASPLSKLAEEFGISGTALAAVCKKHQVPYPGSGYWTRKSLGLEAELPVLPEALEEVIEITPAIPKPRQPKLPKDRATKGKAAKKTRIEHHPLLFGVDGLTRPSPTLSR